MSMDSADEVFFAFLNIKRIFFIGLLLIYNVVLVSGIQQSDSYIYIYSFSDSFPL